MPDGVLRRRRRRVKLIATLAVLVVGGSGAGAVFVTGSSQRKEDRAAYLAYETATLVPIRDAGRIVQEEMKPSIGALGRGELTSTDTLARASGWRNQLESDRADLLAVVPPSFLGDVPARWAAAMDGYRSVVAFIERAAGAAGDERSRLLGQAADAGARADAAFDAAAAIMQYHRRRLGLGSTSHLPDPASTKG